MEQEGYKVYPYRWVVLMVYMFAVAINQMFWITFAAITGDAAIYYGVSDLGIGILSLSFMLVYVFVSIPASWAIDTYGIRKAVGFGVVLTGIFGMMRGIFASNYTLVLIGQIGIAIGQPFLLNALTTVAARWFPMRERATATGLGTLAMYLGIILGLALTPYLTLRAGMAGMLTIYGIASLVAAVTFIAFTRERPPSPPCPPGQDERSLVLDGLKNIFHQRHYLLLLFIFFVGLGVFNAVTTWIEDILRPRHFTSIQAGISGGLMVMGGVIGAVIIPLLSDKLRRRVPFIMLALTGAIPGLIGITYATSYWLLLSSAFIFGFFLLSAGPVGFQYGAEIAFPTPEGTSNGLLILMGQISGIIFIFAMDSLRSAGTGTMTSSLLVLTGLVFLSLLLCLGLRESSLLSGKKEDQKT
jgi:cyanate permease